MMSDLEGTKGEEGLTLYKQNRSVYVGNVAIWSLTNNIEGIAGSPLCQR